MARSKLKTVQRTDNSTGQADCDKKKKKKKKKKRKEDIQLILKKVNIVST